MSGTRIIVMTLILALGLSGWVAQVQALGNPSVHHLASTGADSDGHAGDAECPDAAAAKGGHDHSDQGADCCHLVAPALDLVSPGAYQDSWARRAAFLPPRLEAITGLASSPMLRPPRV